MVDAESINQNVNNYLEKIESRLNRKARLAHEIGAGAPCTKCGSKCPGFELHYWRKLCLNCRCSKDDHDIQDNDEDIGHIIIGKLFDRPDPVEVESRLVGLGGALAGVVTGQQSVAQQQAVRSKKKEATSTTLNMSCDTSARGVPSESLQFEWVPPNIDPDLAARYMTALPQEKRPIVGSQAAKERRQQLGQQMPLYDMDETRRCEAMPVEELQQFKAHLDHVRTHVVGQGIVSEIHLAPRRLVGSIESRPADVGKAGKGGVSSSYRHVEFPGSQSSLTAESNQGRRHLLVGKSSPGVQVRNNAGEASTSSSTALQHPLLLHPEAGYGEHLIRQYGPSSYDHKMADESNANGDWPAPPSPLSCEHSSNFSERNINNNSPRNSTRSSFIEDMLATEGRRDGDIPPGGEGHWPLQPITDPNELDNMRQLNITGDDVNSNQSWSPQSFSRGVLVGQSAPSSLITESTVRGNTAQSGNAKSPTILTSDRLQSTRNWQGLSPGFKGAGTSLLPAHPYGASRSLDRVASQSNETNNSPAFSPGKSSLLPKYPYMTEFIHTPPGVAGVSEEPSNCTSSVKYNEPTRLTTPQFQLGSHNMSPRPFTAVTPGSEVMPREGMANSGFLGNSASKQHLQSSSNPSVSSQPRTKLPMPPGAAESMVFPASLTGSLLHSHASPSSFGTPARATLLRNVPGAVSESHQYQAQTEPYRERLAGTHLTSSSSGVTVLFPSESIALHRHAVTEGSTEYVGDQGSQAAQHSCQQCKEPMMSGDVAVICERAGPKKYWHPRCFICSHCGELLADMIYFWHSGGVYCGRHYHQAASVPRCHACDELIFSESWTRAEAHDWHLNHFTCFLCDTELAGQSYVPSDSGHPYCLPCHMLAVAQTCESCERKVEPDAKQCAYRGYHYHASDECFACHACHKPLLGGKFKMVKNWVFCSQPCVDSCYDDILSNTSTKFKHGDEENKKRHGDVEPFFGDGERSHGPELFPFREALEQGHSHDLTRERICTRWACLPDCIGPILIGLLYGQGPATSESGPCDSSDPEKNMILE